MSLAEKLSTDGPVRALNPSATPALDNILRLALNNAGRVSPAAPHPAERSEVDFGKAALLLDRATSAIAHLTARRDELEQNATAREDYFAEKVQHLQDQASEWERRAKVIKAQLQDSESRITDQQTRIETTTFRAEQAEARVLVAEQQMSEMRKQLQLYHEKIFDTLGSVV